MSTRRKTTSPTKPLSGSTMAKDIIMETSTQICRKYLFIKTEKKALFYLVFVFVVSLYASYFPPDDSYYVAKKHNVFNKYGTKVGWFWTLMTVGPFMWITSYLHHNSHQKALKHLLRLVVATGIWYTVTSTISHIEKVTGVCVGSPKSSFKECIGSGKHWKVIDISGHSFLLIYNILIICEECISFKNWPRTPKSTTLHIASTMEVETFKKMTLSVQGLFIILTLFHFLWDFQLLITCLYYHDVNHKLLGAFTAIISWFITYKVVFPMFPGKPIKRDIKTF